MPFLGYYALAMLEQLETFEDFNRPTPRKKVNLNREVKKVIPNGCKEYIFNESFGTLVVIASNEKIALKKYNKWVQKNNQK